MRYINEGYTVKINLPKINGHKGYFVECKYLQSDDPEKYYLTMGLGRSDIDDRFKIDYQKIDTQKISGTKETIKQNICRIVDQAVKSGFFNKYIERYEYTYKCFDIGNDILERELLSQ